MEIYVEYGFSLEVTVNVVKPGKTGADEIKAMMDNFRACSPKELGGSEVVLVKDYKTLKATDNTGKATDLDMRKHQTYFSSLQPTVQKFLYVLRNRT